VAAARWPGRLEHFRGDPDVVVDGGHNPAAVTAAVRAIAQLGTASDPVLLFGAMADKDLVGMLRSLPVAWPAVFTQVAEARAVPASDLRALAVTLGRVGDAANADPAAALGLARAQAGASGTVVVLGSLYLAGAVRALLAAT
jgi:dihydrofolate synthase/folylpolyglutamate synthase